MRWSSFLTPICCLGVAIACSSSKGSSAGPTARFRLADATPAFLDVPFPTDVYLTGGKIVDPVPGLERVFVSNAQYLTHELGKLNGFSRVSLALFYVDDPGAPPDDNGDVAAATIDAASLPRTETDCAGDRSSVFLVDLAASDPEHARVACRAAFHDDRRIATARPVLAVGPARGVLLEEGHAYAAVVTSRVKDASGRALGASSDFRAVAGGDKSSPARAVYADAIAKVKALLAPALAADGASIVALAPYTTSKMTEELYQMRDALEDAPAPPLSWDAPSMAPMGAARFAAKINGQLPAGFTASLDDWLGVVAPDKKLPDGTDDPDVELPVRAHDKFAAVGSAVFLAQTYLRDKGGYDALDHATIGYDASGKPTPAGTTKIWVTLAIPSAPMPASGYPVVIVGHGLSGSRSYLLDMGNTFAAKGWAVAAIDAVTFGARAPEAKYQVDKTSDYAGKNGAAYTGPDGLADAINGDHNGPVDMFGNLKNLGALRDQLREQGLDIAQLVKLLRSAPDLSPLKTGADTPKIDPDKIAYFGDSFGGITGATAAAIEPHVKAWLLNVAGGGLLLEIAAHGPAISANLAAAGTFNFRFGPERFDESHPLNVIGQTLADPGDPLSYAPFLVASPHALKGQPTAPRNILQTEVVYDELVANEGGEALARAAGMGLAVPNVGSNAGIADLKNIANNPGRVPLKDVPPDSSGAIHDTPKAGVTAVVVQVSPGQHGADIVRAHGQRSYAVPYARTDGSEPFQRLNNPFLVRCPYRELQGMTTRFFDDAFSGKTPTVAGFKPPIRDADDDGVPDDVDPDPNDPRIK